MKQARFAWTLSAILLALMLISLTTPSASSATTPTSTASRTPNASVEAQATQRALTLTPKFNPRDYASAALTMTALAPSSSILTELVGVVRFEGAIREAVTTKDGSRLLVRRSDGQVAVYDVRANGGDIQQPLFVMEHGSSTDGMTLGANDTRLATWQNAGESVLHMSIRVWDPRDGRLLHEIKLRDDARFFAKNGATWNRQGTELMLWSRAGEIEVWDMQANLRRLNIRVGGLVWGAAWNPTETRILVWTTGRGVQLFDSADGKFLSILAHQGATLNASWSGDGQTILSAGTDGLAVVSNGESGTPRDIFYHGQYRRGRPDFNIEIWSVAWSEQTGRIFTGTFAGQIRAWQAGMSPYVQDKPITTVDLGSFVSELTTNPDGSRVFFRAGGPIAGLWDGWSSEPFFTTSKAARTNPAMNLMAVWDAYGVGIHATQDGAQIAQLGHPVEALSIRGVIWLEDDLLLSHTENGEARLWRLQYRENSATVIAPTATSTIPQSRARFAPLAAGPRSVSFPLSVGTVIGQTFVAVDSWVESVEIALIARNRFGGTARLQIKTLDGEVLSTTDRFVPPQTAEMQPFALETPLSVVPGQVYRLELTVLEEAQFSVEFTDGFYPGGYAYLIEKRDDQTLVQYRVHDEVRFKVNITPLAELHGLETRIAGVQTVIPATRVAAYATGTAVRQRDDANGTATAAAINTRTAILGITPDLLDALRIGLGGSLVSSFEALPGSEHQFVVGAEQCCYVFEAVNIKVQWSISSANGPANAASIDADTGLFRVTKSAPNGARYAISARLEDGSLLTAGVIIYTPEGNPFVGRWQEDAQIACDDGSFVKPSDPIGELTFRADGAMFVTWFPFEVYFDYQGTYSYDLASGQFGFQARPINYLPRELDTDGTFSLDSEGRLVLKDLWLGISPNGSSASMNCGHRFVWRGKAYR